METVLIFIAILLVLFLFGGKIELSEKNSTKKLLQEMIEHNANLISKIEGKSLREAEYLSICALLEDLEKRENGREGYQITMKEILPRDYPYHLNDVLLYITYKSGVWHLKPDVEKKILERHAVKKPSSG